MKIADILTEDPMTPKTSKAPVGSNIAPKKNPYGSPKKGNDEIDMNPGKSDHEDQEFDPEIYKWSVDAAGKKVTSNTPSAKPAKVKGIQPGKTPSADTMDNRNK
jgi:hypothetical protein